MPASRGARGLPREAPDRQRRRHVAAVERRQAELVAEPVERLALEIDVIADQNRRNRRPQAHGWHSVGVGEDSNPVYASTGLQSYSTVKRPPNPIRALGTRASAASGGRGNR